MGCCTCGSPLLRSEARPLRRGKFSFHLLRPRPGVTRYAPYRERVTVVTPLGRYEGYEVTPRNSRNPTGGRQRLLGLPPGVKSTRPASACPSGASTSALAPRLKARWNSAFGQSSSNRASKAGKESALREPSARKARLVRRGKSNIQDAPRHR